MHHLLNGAIRAVTEVHVASVCVCVTCSAEKKEKVSAQKKAHKLYEKLGEEEEKCKSKLASCETRDIRARQVRPSKDEL